MQSLKNKNVQPNLTRYVIRVLLKQMLDEKSFKERMRITLNEVSEETGISRVTLNRISNVPGYNANTDSIDALCKYFECTPCELLSFHFE